MGGKRKKKAENTALRKTMTTARPVSGSRPKVSSQANSRVCFGGYLCACFSSLCSVYDLIVNRIRFDINTWVLSLALKNGRDVPEGPLVLRAGILQP